MKYVVMAKELRLIFVAVCFSINFIQAIEVEQLCSNEFDYLEKKALSQEILHKAILCDSSEEIKQAVRTGADINFNRDGKHHLLWAVLLKRSNAIKTLLEYEIDTDISYLGKSIIQHAIMLKDFESASRLYKKGFVCNEQECDTITRFLYEELRFAFSAHSPINRIREIISLGANISLLNQVSFKHKILKDGNSKAYPTVIEGLIRDGRNNLLEELLRNRLDPNSINPESGKSLLQYALSVSNINVALLLVKNGADYMYSKNVEECNFQKTVLSEVIFRIKHNYVSIVQGFEFLQELVNLGYEINGDRWSTNALNLILHSGSMSTKDIELLDFFIQHGADPNRVIFTNEIMLDSYTTPLFLAIFNGLCSKEKAYMALEKLLEAGANVNKKAMPVYRNQPERGLDKLEFITPLYFATKFGQSEIVNLLIKYGAEL